MKKIEFGDEYYVTQVETEGRRDEYAQALFGKLRETLNAAGIKESLYSIGNPRVSDCFLLCKEGVFWAVSYLERGSRWGPAFFFDIHDAVHFFLWKLTDGKVTIRDVDFP